MIAAMSLLLILLGGVPAVAAGPHAWARPAASELLASGAWPSRSAYDLSMPATRRELAAGLRLLAEDAEFPTPVEQPLEEAAPESTTGEFPDRTDAPGDGDVGQGVQTPARPDVSPTDGGSDPDLAVRAQKLATGLERRPGAKVPARLGHRSVVRALGFAEEEAGLSSLRLGGRSLRLPPAFATEILARELGLRHNYPSRHERHERGGSEPLSRADVAGMIAAARRVDSGDRFRLSRYRAISLPAANARRAAVVTAAIGYVGHVYVWGGDWPNAGSPWGFQERGGFDCSGLAWMAFKGARPSASLGLDAALAGRVADDMAWERPSEMIRAGRTLPGDLVFFADDGRRAGRGDVSHMGIALGDGWMIHSSGSRAGVSISHLTAYWPGGIVHARRIAALGA